MRLDENYEVKADGNNFELHYSEEFDSHDKSGNPIVSTRSETWYFATMQQVLKRYLTEHIRGATNKDAEDILQAIKRVEGIIEKL